MQKQKHHHNNPHIPVLLEASLRYLAPKRDESYLDLTAGYGGHAREVIKHTNSPERATLVDRDKAAIESLADLAQAGANVVHSDYASYAKELAASERSFDMIMIDLGVSSPQLDEADRGFSFRHNGPLDMRMDRSQEETAADLLNALNVSQLTALLKDYGEEPHSKKIAEAIVRERPITTTSQLADLIEQTVYRRGRKHPATRTFQALRIALNREIEQLETTLPLIPTLLNPDGRVVVISFHSLEDRRVKQYFQNESRAGFEATLKLLTKKPLTSADELVFNPRSRSAKLRAALKINTH